MIPLLGTDTSKYIEGGQRAELRLPLFVLSYFNNIFAKLLNKVVSNVKLLYKRFSVSHAYLTVCKDGLLIIKRYFSLLTSYQEGGDIIWRHFLG